MSVNGVDLSTVPIYLNARAAARRLGISTSIIKTAIGKGELPILSNGHDGRRHHAKIPVHELDARADLLRARQRVVKPKAVPIVKAAPVLPVVPSLFDEHPLLAVLQSMDAKLGELIALWRA